MGIRGKARKPGQRPHLYRLHGRCFCPGKYWIRMEIVLARGMKIMTPLHIKMASTMAKERQGWAFMLLFAIRFSGRRLLFFIKDMALPTFCAQDVRLHVKDPGPTAGRFLHYE